MKCFATTIDMGVHVLDESFSYEASLYAWKCFSHKKQNCLCKKINGLIYPYKVVVAKHLMGIHSWPQVKF